MPILPETSSDELSEIEEEHENAVDNESDASSHYMSSVMDLGSNASSLSITGDYQRMMNASVGNLFGDSENASVLSNGNSNIPNDSPVQQTSVDVSDD